MNGVVVIMYGTQSVDLLAKAAKLCKDGGRMRTDVARMAGASFAFGDPAELDEIARRLSTHAIDLQKHLTPSLSFDAINWLACGNRGYSSNAMFTFLTGVDAIDNESDGMRVAHPYDPDDLDRCLSLLNEVPELRSKLPKMKEASPAWDALINRWDEIEQLHLEEVGLGWSKGDEAPKTYALMAKILDGVKS